MVVDLLEKEKKEFTPDNGFNLVGIDYFVNSSSSKI